MNTDIFSSFNIILKDENESSSKNSIKLDIANIIEIPVSFIDINYGTIY